MLTGSPQPNVGSADARGLRWRFWLLTPIVGILTGVAAGLLMRLLFAVEAIAWGKAASESLLQAVGESSPSRRIAILVGAGVFVAAVRWTLRRATGGHGAEVTQAIWFEAGLLSFWRTLINAVVSIVVVGLGASLGREAAPKQMGAFFGGALAHWIKLPPSQCRLLAAIGAGAGVAAVYNVPFGGALFALEVLLGTLSLPLVPPALVASATATAVAWLFLPNEPSYHIDFIPASTSLFVWAALFGPLAGLLGAAYVRLISWCDTVKPRRPVALMLAPVVVFFCLGALGGPLPQVLGNGKPVVQLALAGALTSSTLLALVVLKPLATAACLGSGAPGGLFTPTLTLGAVFGGLLGSGWMHIWPDAPAGAYAIIGAAAVMAAASQGPVSTIVLTLELTRRLDTLMVPLMIAVGGATLVGRLIESRSIYSGRIHAARHAAEEREARVATISAAARYAELLQLVSRAAPRRENICILGKTGETIGQVDVERALNPAPFDGPLETASAGDFVRSPAAEAR